MSFSAQPLGVLDGRMDSSPSKSNQSNAYTHNPYWYEGFNPLALTGAVQYQPYSYTGFGFDDERPYIPYWAERRHPVRHLRASNLQYLAHAPVMNFMRSPPTSDNSSDQTLGYSDGERSDKSGDDRDCNLEAQLVQCIIDYFGDCKGSLPSERVQNVIKKDHAELYDAVVVARYRKKWHKFLQHCADTFHLFTRPAQPAPNQDYCWRIRLVNNPDWEEADALDEEYRNRRDKESLDKVHAILSASPEGQTLMIDVINEMNKDIKGDDNGKDDGEEEFHSRKPRKIRAGDLKRLMRKCNSNFTIVECQDADGQKRATYMKLMDPVPAY